MALTGISDGTGWPRNKEASSKITPVPVCIVQGQELGTPASTGLREGHLPAGTVLVPDSDVSGEACYVVMDTARLATGGTGEQDETHALVLWEDVYGLHEADQLSTALLIGVWTSSPGGGGVSRLRYKGTALTADQKARFQRITEWWNSW